MCVQVCVQVTCKSRHNGSVHGNNLQNVLDLLRWCVCNRQSCYDGRVRMQNKRLFQHVLHLKGENGNAYFQIP